MDATLICVTSEPAATSLQIWTAKGFREHILSGTFSAQASSARQAPVLSQGSVRQPELYGSADSFLIASENWQPDRLLNENEVLAACAMTLRQSPVEEICLFIAGSGGPRPLVAPQGILPAAVAKGVHPAEAAWQLACSLTGRDDFSSFHRFAVNWHKSADQWYRIHFYTTGPDRDEPLPVCLTAEIEQILTCSPKRHSRAVRQSDFIRTTMELS